MDSTFKKLLTFIFVTLFLSFLGLTYATASIPNSQTGQNIQKIEGALEMTPPLEDTFLTKKNIEALIPVHLTPTTSSESFNSEFQKKLEQKALDKFFESQAFKKSAPGHAVETLKSITEKSVNLGALPTGRPQEIKFRVLAIEKQAELFYSGLLDARLCYYLDQKLATWNFSKPLGESSQLTLANSFSELPAGTAANTNSNLSSRLIFDYSF